MTMSIAYQAYGMIVHSDVELPLPEVRDTAPGLIIAREDALSLSPRTLDRRAADVIAWFGKPDDPWYVAKETEHGFLVSFRGTAEFAISTDLSRVGWRAHPRADVGMIPVLLSGTVLAFVLVLAGNLTLHASAVAVARRAIAFVGHSGMGKTTMAALAVARGAAAVTDDVLIARSTDPPICCGSGGELRLRQESRAIRDDLLRDVEVSETGDGRLLVLPAVPHHGWIELGAIVVPLPRRDVEAVEVRRVPSSEALVQLTSFPRIYALTQPKAVREQFEQLAQLCARVPVFTAKLPWGPPFDPSMFDEIVRRTNEACN